MSSIEQSVRRFLGKSEPVQVRENKDAKEQPRTSKSNAAAVSQETQGGAIEESKSAVTASQETQGGAIKERKNDIQPVGENQLEEILSGVDSPCRERACEEEDARPKADEDGHVKPSSGRVAEHPAAQPVPHGVVRKEVERESETAITHAGAEPARSVLMPMAEPRLMAEPPFPKDKQLNHELHRVPDPDRAETFTIELRTKAQAASPDKAGVAQGETPVVQVRLASQTLPGQPRIRLDLSIMQDYLSDEFSTPGLEESPWWLRLLGIKRFPFWLMTTPKHHNINNLTSQIVRGRELVVTEELRLHLLWGYGQIFVKPIPRYLLSHAFWEHYLCHGSLLQESTRIEIVGHALGFLRTYAHLIQHESDFLIARDAKHRLVPEDVDWEKFWQFISHFEDLNKECVPPIPNRFRYGQISFFKLNLWYYFIRPWSYKSYVSVDRKWGARSKFVLFFFAFFSLACSAMQSGMKAVEELQPTLPWHNARTFWIVCRGFSVAIFIFVASAVAIFLSLWVLKVIRQAVYTLWVKTCCGKRRGTKPKGHRGRCCWCCCPCSSCAKQDDEEDPQPCRPVNSTNAPHSVQLPDQQKRRAHK
jgi:hypothetical protein